MAWQLIKQTSTLLLWQRGSEGKYLEWFCIPQVEDPKTLVPIQAGVSSSGGCRQWSDERRYTVGELMIRFGMTSGGEWDSAPRFHEGMDELFDAAWLAP